MQQLNEIFGLADNFLGFYAERIVGFLNRKFIQALGAEQDSAKVGSQINERRDLGPNRRVIRQKRA